MEKLTFQKIFNKKNIIWFLIFGVPVVAALIGFFVPNPFFPNRDQLQERLNEFGVLAPFVFTIIATIPVVITPLNHMVFALTAGALFGFWEGFFIIWISKSVGSIINFYISRFLGQGIVEKFASKLDLKKYDDILQSDKALIILFLIFLVPFLSNDNLTYLVGLSHINAKKFLTAISLAHIGPSFTFVYLGSGGSLLSPVFIVFVCIMIFAGYKAYSLQNK